MTLVEIVVQVVERQERLDASRAQLSGDDVETLVRAMHRDLAEFMDGCLTWMQCRERGIPADLHL